MTKARDIFKVFESYNYVTKDKNGDVYVWKNKPVIDEKYKEWIERLNFTKANYMYVGKEFKIEEFKSKSWKECLIEREKPLKTYDEFVKWLKTKGDVDEQWGYFFKENNKENIGIRFYPVDVNFKINDIELCAGVVECEEFFTGTPEQCKRVIEDMLEE